ncbi:uncharacterized protein LOC115632777 [Scaptodrosophila lebanonensis]|uniref:Uncharacterized protein LOC115632777 n=1 Tax=Drosophila lebanonensis TaxID=7225 RepID=A0A6J2UBM6_DROLE|nr:uncharacterized protein LOC115632777 [Scaptodrosophila lebanonensis]
MDYRGGLLLLVILGTIGTAYPFVEKAPIQASLIQGRSDKNGGTDDPVPSSRNIEEHLLKTIGKGGIKFVVGSGESQTASKPTKEEHQHHYYFPTTEEYNHPRQPWPSQPWPSRPWPHPHPPPPPPPVRPQWPYGAWGYNQWPYNQWGNGWGNGWGWNTGWDLPGYGGNHGYSGYPGYPYYPFFRTSAGGQQEGGPTDFPPPIDGRAQGFPQSGFLSAGNNYIEGKSNPSASGISSAGPVPLYQLLNLARV